MKKIAILALAEKSNGGTYQYTIKLIQTLCSLEGDYTIFTDTNNCNYDNLGIEVKKYNFSKKRWPIVILCYLFNLKLFDPLKEFDLVIAPIYSPFLLLTKTNFVFTLHDLQEYYYPAFFSKLEIIWRKFINLKLVKKSSYIICESSFVKDDIINFFGCSAEKVIIISGPAPLINFQIDFKQESIVLNKFNLLKNNYIIYPAQFWKHKNHIRLIKAFKILYNKYPNIRLVLTGKKRFEYENIVKEIIKLEMTEGVLFTEYLSEIDLGILLKNANFLIMPTLFESISIPIFEAFQLGLPVCASDVVAIPYQVGNAALLFDPSSVIDISEKILQIYEHEDLKYKLINNGQSRLDFFSDSKYASQWSFFLKSL